MARISYFDDYGVYHGQVEAGGHTVVEEGAVLHGAVVSEVVLLVERPSDALHRAALYLPFDVAGVDGFAGVLQGREAQYLDLAGLGVHLDVHDVQREGVADTSGVDGRPSYDGAAGAIELRRQLRESDAQLRVLLVAQGGVVVLDIVGRDVPDAGGALDQLRAGVHSGFVAGVAHLEGNAAAAGAGAVSDGVGVCYGGAHVLDGYLQHFGDVHRHRRAAAADVGRSFHQADRAVRVD